MILTGVRNDLEGFTTSVEEVSVDMLKTGN